MKTIGRVLGWGVALGALVVLGLVAGREHLPRSSPADAPEPAAVAPEGKPATEAKRWELESQEAGLAALALAKENENLRKQVRGLQRQIGDLTEALAAREAGPTAVPRRSDGNEISAASPAAADGLVAHRALQLIDVNASLQMVVLDAGSQDGIVTGMRFSVVRDGKPVGRARVVEVRQQIAGAEVEEMLGNDFPRKGDHVVPWKSTGS